MSENENAMYYAGHRRECGCIVKVSQDVPGFEYVTAQEVAEMIRDGLIVRYVDRDYLNIHWDECWHSTLSELAQPTFFPVLAVA